jgi:putative endonuclease
MSNKSKGTLGEKIAEGYLKSKGLQIVEKNWTCRWGELDFVARHQGILVFVEVKYRTRIRYGHPFEAINQRKRSNLMRTINLYLQKNLVYEPWRFDVVCVVKQKRSMVIDYYDFVPI